MTISLAARTWLLFRDCLNLGGGLGGCGCVWRLMLNYEGSIKVGICWIGCGSRFALRNQRLRLLYMEKEIRGKDKRTITDNCKVNLGIELRSVLECLGGGSKSNIILSWRMVSRKDTCPTSSIPDTQRGKFAIPLRKRRPCMLHSKTNWSCNDRQVKPLSTTYFDEIGN